MNNIIKRFFQWLFRRTPKQYVSIDNSIDWVQFEQDTLLLINDLRGNKVEGDKNLHKFAKGRVKDLKKDPKSGHSGYYKKAHQLGDLGFDRTAECIGFGQTTPKGIVNAWSKSIKHDAIMRDPNFKYAGIAYEKVDKKTFIVLNLGK